DATVTAPPPNEPVVAGPAAPPTPATEPPAPTTPPPTPVAAMAFSCFQKFESLPPAVQPTLARGRGRRAANSVSVQAKVIEDCMQRHNRPKHRMQQSKEPGSRVFFSAG